jgi:glycosyltransferase involved in cell wall biosynthesis
VGDPDALARGMQRMADRVLGSSSREALAEIGQANRDYVCSHFRQSETTRRTVEIYRSLSSAERKKG